MPWRLLLGVYQIGEVLARSWGLTQDQPHEFILQHGVRSVRCITLLNHVIFH